MQDALAYENCFRCVKLAVALDACLFNEENHFVDAKHYSKISRNGPSKGIVILWVRTCTCYLIFSPNLPVRQDFTRMTTTQVIKACIFTFNICNHNENCLHLFKQFQNYLESSVKNPNLLIFVFLVIYYVSYFRWFQGFHWEGLRNQNLSPPIIPKVKRKSFINFILFS